MKLSEDWNPEHIASPARLTGNKRVPLEVSGRASFHEDVGLVNEEHGAPVLGLLEVTGEVFFYSLGVCPDITSVEDHQRALHELGDAFWAQGSQTSMS